MTISMGRKGRWNSEIKALRVERDRLRAFAQELAEEDCHYGDDCPTFGSRHGKCTRCKAREALCLPHPQEEKKE